MSTYSLVYDEQTGALTGAARDAIFIPRSAPAWAEVAAWAAAQSPPVDLSDRDPPIAAERVAQLASAAVADTLARAATDPFCAAVVALFDTVFTLVNDLRERNGDSRLTPNEIFPAAIQALIARQGGAPPAPPPAPP